MRPAFIQRAGKALSAYYDSRGLPALFTILSLGDLRRDDLTAIGQVWTRLELKDIRNKAGTGRSALEVLSEVSRRLKGGVTSERNAFSVPHAVRNTNLKTELKRAIRPGQRPGTDVMGEDGEEDLLKTPDIRQRYGDIAHQPLDHAGELTRRKLNRK